MTNNTRDQRASTSIAAANSERSIPRWVTWSTLIFGAGWLTTIGVLWAVTGRTVPIINVRWTPGVTAEQRVQVERDLSLVLRQPQRDRTGSYFVMRPDEETVKRIVIHPLVEDTAFVSRSTFKIENAPAMRLWIGDRMTFLKRSDMLYTSVLALLVGLATIIFAPKHQASAGAPSSRSEATVKGDVGHTA